MIKNGKIEVPFFNKLCSYHHAYQCSIYTNDVLHNTINEIIKTVIVPKKDVIDVIIIGAGPAGIACASEARTLGYEAADLPACSRRMRPSVIRRSTSSVSPSWVSVMGPRL